MRVLFSIILAAAVILVQVVACTPVNQQRNAELIVEYNGTEVYRAGTPFKSLKDFEKIIENKTKTKYVIFSAKWCNSCAFLNKALKQSGHWDQVVLLDIDERWVAGTAASLGIKAVPTMVVVDKDDSIVQTFEGPSAIVMYLLIHVNKS